MLDSDMVLYEYAGDLVQPIADAAGTDISHWFDPKTGDVKRLVLHASVREYSESTYSHTTHYYIHTHATKI